MDYALAKKLKDSGFPKKVQKYFVCDKCQYPCPPVTNSGYPTLEELIEACGGKWGQRFRWLSNEKTYWLAQARPMHPKSKKYPDSPIKKTMPDIKAKGQTPSEAVANLWLALQVKK